jgi:hemolysin III
MQLRARKSTSQAVLTGDRDGLVTAPRYSVTDGGTPAPGPTVAVVQTDQAVTPLLRGWLHLACFFLSLPAGVWLVLHAPSGQARVAVAVYAVCMTLLFAASGTYHRRRWSATWRARLKRVDHGAIFVMIAGTYTPVCLIALGGVFGTLMLVSVWIGAVIGVVLALVGIAERRLIGGVCYVALGWAAVATFPALVHRLSAEQLALIVVGGVMYTVGVILLGARRPNPFPSVFGYHEVWHVLVVAAAVCHFVAIQSFVAVAA